MLQTTPLHKIHEQAGAKLVDFGGWHMPLHYGSQLQEHHAVREDAGVFDVSHMAVVDVSGKDATAYLRYLLANDVAKLKNLGKALYTCMLNPSGGIIDDLIVYKLAEGVYRLVVNAATREKDWGWLQKQALSFNVELQQREDLAMLAVQGPHAIKKTLLVLTAAQQEAVRALQPFYGVASEGVFFGRTGYTGEDGLEIQLPGTIVNDLWHKLLEQGVKACGLGARDTLRLEAGLNLYGVDMDETTSPLESNLAWTVAFEPSDRDFIGKIALEQQLDAGVKRKLVGLVLETPGVLRNHQKVIFANDDEVGEITSGSFSPTLGHAIALARVPVDVEGICQVEIRNKLVPVRVVSLPFVRAGVKYVSI
jgi:aminomethyltransferase